MKEKTHHFLFSYHFFFFYTLGQFGPFVDFW